MAVSPPPPALTKAERQLLLGTVATLALFIDNEHLTRGWSSTISDEDREFLLATAGSQSSQYIVQNLVRILRAAVG